ncbi:MAG: GNAT family N-acetyltransferase, partial [Acidimicrobiales bacterium]
PTLAAEAPYDPDPDGAVRLVPIATERLLVRALQMEDLDAVYEIVGDEAVTAGATWFQPDLESCSRSLTRRLSDEVERGYSLWGVELSDDPGVIGLAGFFPHDDELELGYAFRADQWGHGYATEAALAVMKVAEGLGRRVYATIRSTNVRSLAVAQKIGLVHSGEKIEDERGTKLIFRTVH